MEFRLTYRGALSSTQRDALDQQRDKVADHKHALRREFHRQLKRLWEITPYLHNAEGVPHLSTKRDIYGLGGKPHDIKTLAETHALDGFNFVPLVTHDMDLLCGLDILFLRPDKPGDLLWAGDIDNRIKTLIDALRIPKSNEGYAQRTVEASENHFFCLLEDDALVTKLAVESDQLLEFPDHQTMNQVQLVVTVRIRPYQMHQGNLEFGG